MFDNLTDINQATQSVYVLTKYIRHPKLQQVLNVFAREIQVNISDGEKRKRIQFSKIP